MLTSTVHQVTVEQPLKTNFEFAHNLLADDRWKRTVPLPVTRWPTRFDRVHLTDGCVYRQYVPGRLVNIGNTHKACLHREHLETLVGLELRDNADPTNKPVLAFKARAAGAFVGAAYNSIQYPSTNKWPQCD